MRKVGGEKRKSTSMKCLAILASGFTKRDLQTSRQPAVGQFDGGELAPERFSFGRRAEADRDGVRQKRFSFPFQMMIACFLFVH